MESTPINRLYEEIQIGEKAFLTKVISNEDVINFSKLSGDTNPIHLDDEFASKSFFKKRIAHGILTSSLISAVIGTKLPGVNTLYLSQTLNFVAPVFIGDELTAEVEVISKRDDKRLLKLKTNVINQKNVEVITGEALVKKLK
ncbi:MaoC family dehydratase [Clostridium cochlearium]|uniref:MaoC family dehydratase n=1 Tax=Clostridium cochlearium TaxID=1494 RepID=UPI001EDE60B8|nr:MaoC family dehydratase [Clostridium cochlearium]MBV1820464.1 MaoC family dehydratase [Bacteroidales bacterium MSK.15.36]MCG4570937.1 MaoC family dehydratase [Clostridium cochlearium]MCG4581060.1 MaoC family dehydratase [Clostridium cochlearium]